MDLIERIGSYVGMASFLGLAILALLYFSQARDVRRLRDWAGRAPERLRPQRPVARRGAGDERRGRPEAPLRLDVVTHRHESLQLAGIVLGERPHDLVGCRPQMASKSMSVPSLSKRIALRSARAISDALRLPFRVLGDTFGPGRAFVPSRVQLMLVGMEADAQGM